MGWASLFCDSDCTSALIIGMSFIAVMYWLRRRKENFPPGPRGLPIVGYIPFVGEYGAETLKKLKTKYGPVMSIQFGIEDWIVLNDFESISECLVKQGEKFSGRTKNAVLDVITWGKGIAFIDYGKSWKQLRKFGLMTLRGFGVGRKGMEENVVEETPYLLEELTKGNGEPHMTLTNAVTNIICRVTFGTRFDYNDEKFTTLIEFFREFVTDTTDMRLFGLAMAAPILRHFPIFRGAIQRSIAKVDVYMNILKGIIDEHKANFDKDDLRDFIDAFLAEQQQRGPDDETFEDDQLLQYIRDLFEAGAGTTSSTLTWGLLALLHYPECQTKIAEEIQNTIGDSGIPSMKHREKMNYTCAFIHELMRHRTLVPTAIMHKTNEAADINGYTIPKDTTIIPNIWAVHHDPDLFENPEVFKPERFLDENGKFVKSKYVIPFSIGPRHCLGDQLARMEIFIFLTSIIQKLKVLPDPLNPPPSLSSGFMPFLSTYEPPQFKVIFEHR